MSWILAGNQLSSMHSLQRMNITHFTGPNFSRWDELVLLQDMSHSSLWDSIRTSSPTCAAIVRVKLKKLKMAAVSHLVSARRESEGDRADAYPDYERNMTCKIFVAVLGQEPSQIAGPSGSHGPARHISIDGCVDLMRQDVNIPLPRLGQTSDGSLELPFGYQDTVVARLARLGNFPFELRMRASI